MTPPAAVFTGIALLALAAGLFGNIIWLLE